MSSSTVYVGMDISRDRLDLYLHLGVAGMFSHAMVVNASGYDYAQLASEARFVIEELRARPFLDPVLNPTTGATWAPQSASYSNRDFVATYSVTGTSSPPTR